MRNGLKRSASLLSLPPLLLGLLVPILACGAGSDRLPYAGPRGPDELHACALFPASEAKGELGGLEIGQLSGPLDASSGTKFARCAYGYGPGASLVAALDIRRYENPAVLRRNLEGALPILRRLTAGDVAAVPGAGDFAWWAGGELRMLKVGWRDLELTVTVQAGVEPGRRRAAAERIARRAIYRLAGEPVPGELLLIPRAVTLGAPMEAPAVGP